MRRLPILRTLQTFEIVSVYPSFSAAAAAQGMTHGAISHQMRALETWIGKEIFVRHSGGVRLTGEGETLRLACDRAFTILEEELLRLRQNAENKAISVGCSSTMLAHWLLPRIDAFSKAEPDVSVSFQTRSDLTALKGGRIDVLIVSDSNLSAPGIVATRLAIDRIGPVCAPSRKDMPKIASDLAKVPLLHASSRINAWEEWSSASGAGIDSSSGRIFESLLLSIEAACGGLGFAMTPEFVVRSDIREGRLVAPLGFIELQRSTWVCIREVDAGDPSIKAFLNWVVGDASAS